MTREFLLQLQESSIVNFIKQNSRFAIFDTELQVEILGNDILIYFSSKPYSWGRVGKKAKQQKKPCESVY